MTTLTDLTREQIQQRRERHVHTGIVDRVTGDGIFVSVEGEDPSGPFLYMAVGTPGVGDPCVVLDTEEGDRFVLAPFGA